MSSLIRTIQRTLTRKLRHRKGRHFYGRGQRLGTKNPRDPSVTGKTKPKKPWRDRENAPKAKLAISVAHKPVVIDASKRTEAHQFKMLERARRAVHFNKSGNDPDRVERLLGNGAGVNRHTGKPHSHERASLRRLRQRGESHGG